MTNFIFKSREDLQKINQSILLKLNLIQNELRHQRVDHIKILSLLEKLSIDDNLQKQVDDFYEKPAIEDLD